MEEYMTKIRDGYGSGIDMPKIDDKAHFELIGQFLKELRDNTFSGSDHKDANEHIEKVLEIFDLFHIPDITLDKIMLRAFPMLLTGAASHWLRNEPSAANARIAIQEMAEHSQKWHAGTSTRTKCTETSDGIATIQAHLNNLRREIKKINEKEISSLLALVQDPIHQQFTGPAHQLTSAVRNRLGKEQIPQDLDKPASDAALREYCDRNYHQLLPITAEKVSQHFESGTPSRRRDLKKRLGSKNVRSMTESPEPRRGRFESPRKKDLKIRTVFKRMEKRVFHRLGDKRKSMSAYSNDSRRRSYHSSYGDTESCYHSSRSRETKVASEKRHNKRASSQRMEAPSGSEDSAGGHWKSKPKRITSSKKCIKDPVEIHNIKQRDEESTKEFLRRGEVAASSREQKKSLSSWKQQEAGQKQNFKKGGFRNQQRSERKQDMFTLLIITPKEILALDKGKFKPPPPMTPRTEAKQWERPGKGSRKKGNLKKGQATSNTDGTTMAKGSQTKDYPNFLSEVSDLFPTLRGGGWDGGFCPEVRSQMVPATIPVVRFSGKIIWPLGKVTIPVQWNHRKAISKENRGSSDYNSQTKFLVTGRTVTLRSSRIIPLECIMVLGPGMLQPLINQVMEEKIQKPADMTGVPHHIAKHSLNICKGCLPVRKKKRGQAPEKNKAIYEEVEKLMDTDIMKEAHYPSWLSNPAFQKQIGQNLEVYVDDLVIKSRTEQEVIIDIEEMFKTLREINMKLNPKKCTFGIREGMFLSYKVNANGLKVCPDKVEAVFSLPSPKCLKDVQKLNGKPSSLNKFLSESAKKSMPFFKTLRKCIKKSDFQWTAKAETMISNPKVTGRVLKRRLELEEHDIHYRVRTSVKGQILADFIVERLENDPLDTPMEDKEELPDP
nr:reverse transcriptase domain-containing protein [Tanacetum cinerariifolium]